MSLPHFKRSLIFSLFCVFLSTSCSDSDDEIVSVLPEVTSISPSYNFKTTVVAITGANFSTAISDNVATFNGKECEGTAATPTQITVEVPAAADSGPVVVITRGNAATPINQLLLLNGWSVRLQEALLDTSMGLPANSMPLVVWLQIHWVIFT